LEIGAESGKTPFRYAQTNLASAYGLWRSCGGCELSTGEHARIRLEAHTFLL